MTGPRWRDELAGTRAAYEQDLLAYGFTKDDERTWTGQIMVPAAGEADEQGRFRLVIPEDFPFSWPVVCLAEPPTVYDWHLQPPGQLCLWRREDDATRPWETVDGLVGRIRQWYQNARDGWPGDQGDLDLQLFFTRDADYVLVTYGELAELTGRRLSREGDRRGWVRLVPRRPGRQEQRWGYGADLGVLEHPVWNWKTVLDAMEPSDRAEVERLASTSKPGLLLLRYVRAGSAGPQEAAAVLSATPRRGTVPELRSMAVAQDTLATRNLRAGPEAPRLAGASAAVIGCGAVGSFLAEILARSGVGRIVLVDDDRLMPGNCVRHLAGPRHVPQFKVDAIEAILAERQLATAVSVHRQKLEPELAFRLLTECDIVIDTAADGSVTGLLEHLATVTRTIFVKAALHRDGAVLRVDRLGRGTATTRPAPIPSLGTGNPLREAGCSDPISPTPPSAVLAAASAACRMAVDTLQAARRRRLPDAMVEILVPQPDPPYDEIGILT